MIAIHQFGRRLISHCPLISRASSSGRYHKFKAEVEGGPELSTFISTQSQPGLSPLDPNNVYVTKRQKQESVPYFDPSLLNGQKQKVMIETYGCQMNVSDTQIVSQILQDNDYVITNVLDDAQIVLIMTCAIRESAEKKIWTRLAQLAKLKASTNLKQVGILGCMAERLKVKLIEKQRVLDIVAGPDSYKDLPKLLAINRTSGMNAVNVILSFDETYADVIPTHGLNRLDGKCPVTAFISIMRGCDNMCSYCIVPFVRGKERSRDVDSILKEVEHCSQNGVKDITLLGQNVNSYRDKSQSLESNDVVKMSPGFKTVYKPKVGGLTFDHLLTKVAAIDPEIRIRFTSPHPKDFPEEFIDVISSHDNICKSIHLPAQSGSNTVLESMRRGYTRESYLELVQRFRSKIPEVTFTSDFIAGFCGETEEDHKLTLDLIDQVKYQFIYTFPYSMREKTRAHHHLDDNVPHGTKLRRAQEIADLFRVHAAELNSSFVSTSQVVLVESTSKRSEKDFVGRCDNNVKVIFPIRPLTCKTDGQVREPRIGDYVLVNIMSSTSQTLKGEGAEITNLKGL